MAVHQLQVGDTFVSAKSGITLKVAERRSDWTTLASQDGRTFERGVWHTDADGAETDSVWVEAWDGFDQCQFHGTVDAVSRKVTQVG